MRETEGLLSSFSLGDRWRNEVKFFSGEQGSSADRWNVWVFVLLWGSGGSSVSAAHVLGPTGYGSVGVWVAPLFLVIPAPPSRG